MKTSLEQKKGKKLFDLRIKHVGAITTTIVIALGIIMVMPPFMQPAPPLRVLLAFSVTDEDGAASWCHDLSRVLEKYDIKATVFVSGIVADKDPSCVTNFSDNVDIGSQTYHYTPLATSDYTEQLDEVKRGKAAVDKAGGLSSKLFMAPYGITDQNIYSLLSRSDILADFSYEHQYNKYYQGQFIRFDIDRYDGTQHNSDFFRSLNADKPVLITFDDSTPIEKISDFISSIKSRHFVFENASDVTGINLTIRQGEKN